MHSKKQRKGRRRGPEDVGQGNRVDTIPSVDIGLVTSLCHQISADDVGSIVAVRTDPREHSIVVHTTNWAVANRVNADLATYGLNCRTGHPVGAPTVRVSGWLHA